MTSKWKPIRLLVFDLDGTLVDSNPDLTLAVNAMRRKMNLGDLPLAVVAGYLGHGVTVLVRRALGDLATEENVEKGLAIFLDHYSHHLLDHTVLYPGVAEALEVLNSHKLAVLTNKPLALSLGILTGLGVAKRFTTIYGGGSFPVKKPDPMGLHKLLEDLHIPADQALMVGDSDTDVLTGRNAGIWTCGVTYGYGRATFEKAPPDLVIDNMRQLPPLLNGQPEA